MPTQLPTQLPTQATSCSYDCFAGYATAHEIDPLLIKTRSKSSGETLSDLKLPFSANELASYVDHRTTGLADLSQDWINRSAGILWDTTAGNISKSTM
ncbi:MAG: hypothetical protein ACXV49_07365, partial [Halobacteriota archaeon]